MWLTQLDEQQKATQRLLECGACWASMYGSKAGCFSSQDSKSCNSVFKYSVLKHTCTRQPVPCTDLTQVLQACLSKHMSIMLCMRCKQYSTAAPCRHTATVDQVAQQLHSTCGTRWQVIIMRHNCLHSHSNCNLIASPKNAEE